jgi:putative FmdB family regulatory protein
MPIYEYECRECGHVFEYLVLPASPAAECPSCRNKDLKQLISLCGVSSENTRQANLKSAQRKANAVLKDKQHEEHKELHEHFHDHYGPPRPPAKK